MRAEEEHGKEFRKGSQQMLTEERRRRRKKTNMERGRKPKVFCARNALHCMHHNHSTTDYYAAHGCL